MSTLPSLNYLLELKDESGFVKSAELQEIEYGRVQEDGNNLYVWVNNEKFSLPKSLKQFIKFAQHLDLYIRVHRSYFVNIKYVDRHSAKELKLLLKSGGEITCTKEGLALYLEMKKKHNDSKTCNEGTSHHSCLGAACPNFKNCRSRKK